MTKKRKNKRKQNTVIELKPDETAFVLGDDFNHMELYLPDTIEDNEVVPHHVAFLTAIAILTKSSQHFIDFIWEKWETIVEDGLEDCIEAREDTIEKFKKTI